MVKKVQAAETWEDVVRISNEIFDYSKSEQMEQKLAQFEEIAMMEQEEVEYEDDSDEYDEDDKNEPKAFGLRCYTSRETIVSPFGLSSKIILFDFFMLSSRHKGCKFL